jgi:pyruvate dehydrogenase E2 component (dihydrolipoamide acetyltransferase)
MAEFRMPSLGADMEAGTLVKWRAKPGDRVKRGDVVAEVETEKGVIEVEIWQDGIVEDLVVPEGQRVPVGTLLARLQGEGEPAVVPSAPPPPAPRAEPVQPAPVAPAPAALGPRVRASPVARQLAQQLGVPLEAVKGTGPGGAIGREDVAAYAASRTPGAAAPQEAAAPLSPMRRAIAATVARSKREIPHYYLEQAISLAAAERWLESQNAQRAVTERVLPVALLIKATALAARAMPELNGHWIDDAFRPSDRVHVGLAIALREGGLVVAGLPDTDRIPVGDLMGQLGGLVERARRGALRSSELEAVTLTVTNLGERGADAVYPVIFPPQVAMVGFGGIAQRACVVDGQLAVRPAVTATLAADHRASNGHQGSRFLVELERLLQAPEAL